MEAKSHALFQKAIQLLDLEKTKEAREALLGVLRLDPGNYEAVNSLGITFVNEDISRAERCFKKALKIKNDYPDALYNLANVYKQKSFLREAINLYKRVFQIDPSIHQANYNIANIYLELTNYDQAIKYFQKAIYFNPQYHEAYSNLGVCFFFKGLVNEAISNYKKSLSIKPDFAEAHFNLALSLLLLGNFQQGWQEYKWRWRLPNFKPPVTNKPFWDGSDNKRLLIFGEQGFGDNIQFVRYVNLILQKNISVILACPDELKSLFSFSFKDIKVVTLKDIQEEDFDCYCPLLDLPRLFNTNLNNIPQQVPYLKASQEMIERFKSLLGNNKRFKVGLIWHGSKDNKRGYYRSVDKRFINIITTLNEIEFVSIHRDNINETEKRIHDFSKELLDFHHTAGLIENLDLIITIDTSVAHLAGALGKPVWLMLHYISDWRWLLDRSDTPWYPSMTIFRQSEIDNWSNVLREILMKLADLRGLRLPDCIEEEITYVHAHAKWDKALQALRNRDFLNGWRDYEWRRNLKEVKDCFNDFGLLEWKGQDLKDKGILIYDEQGFGDTIQFIRFIRFLKNLGARVNVLCRKELFRLIRSFDNDIKVFKRGVDFELSVDYICPLMSLPLYLEIDSEEQLSCTVPYFKIDEKDIYRWNSHFDEKKGIKIGISYESKKGMSYTEKNSIPINVLSELCKLDGILFFIVQKTDKTPYPFCIYDYSSEFTDFYDTASFMMNLDLVISIDSAPVHLAAAIGIETWLLLPFDSEWRWFDDEERTIWYPTVKIFKQKSPGDWKDVINRVKAELERRLKDAK